MALVKIVVDDIYVIVLVGGEDGISEEEWEKFKYDIDELEILKWNITDLSLSVDSLDLTLTIKHGNIVSKTYQKPLNLYQYICPNSAHPPWMLKRIIFSVLKNTRTRIVILTPSRK